jgi:hypothetical protein
MTLAEALAHVERGWATLPVCSDKTPHGRLIRATRGTPGWTQLASTPATEDEVLAWVERDPHTGIGVITGEASGLVVVDVDDPRGAPGLPMTATVVTRRGWHSYFQARGCSVRSRSFAWGELRGNGSYVVAPRSRHASGLTYRWTLSPEEVGLAPFESELENSVAPTPHIRSTGFSTCFLAGRRISDLDRDEEQAIRLAGALGVPDGIEVGVPFACVLHPERHPSAALWRYDDAGRVLYHDFHARPHGGEEWLPLALVRARLAGRQGRLGKPELSIWKLRLAAEAGLLKPVEVAPNASAVTEATPAHVLAGFRQLVSLRWTVTPGAPAPFSARFAAAWCGIGTRQAHEATITLTRLGLLQHVGTDRRGTRLYLPGRGEA